MHAAITIAVIVALLAACIASIVGAFHVLADNKRIPAERWRLAAWGLWLLGPFTLLANATLNHAFPEQEPDPPLPLMGMLVLGSHLAAGPLTLIACFLPGRRPLELEVGLF